MNLSNLKPAKGSQRHGKESGADLDQDMAKHHVEAIRVRTHVLVAEHLSDLSVARCH